MWYQIECESDGKECPPRFAVYGYDTFPQSSVLAGQTRRNFITDYEGNHYHRLLAQAKADYPDAELGGGWHQNYFDHL